MAMPFDQPSVRDDLSGFALISFSHRSAMFSAQSLSDSCRHLWPVNPRFFLVWLMHCPSIVLTNLLMLPPAVFSLLSLLRSPCTKCINSTRGYQSVRPPVQTDASPAREPPLKFWLNVILKVYINYCRSIQHKNNWHHGADPSFRIQDFLAYSNSTHFKAFDASSQRFSVYLEPNWATPHARI